MNKPVAMLAAGFLLIVTAILPASGQQGYSAMKDVEAFKRGLASMSSSTRTIESDFVQEKNLSVLAGKIISKGHFSFRRENNIRWEYLQPYRYLIIISGGKIYIREESAQKQYDIQSSEMFRQMNTFISGCIQGDILKNESDFGITYLENAGEYMVKLVPKSPSMRNMLSEVQLAFDRGDFSVIRINMVEPGGDYTRIDFLNKKLNTDIPIEKFSFQ